eukprot:4491-Heterococcus_DN1.PRE.1
MFGRAVSGVRHWPLVSGRSRNSENTLEISFRVGTPHSLLQQQHRPRFNIELNMLKLSKRASRGGSGKEQHQLFWCVSTRVGTVSSNLAAPGQERDAKHASVRDNTSIDSRPHQPS